MRNVFRVTFWYAFAVVIAVIIVGSNAEPLRADRFHAFYAQSLRGQLFTGFLSMAGFVFALKTFIIMTMKRELYDLKAYEEHYLRQKQLDASLRRYQPLNAFRVLLAFTTLACFAAAVTQFTVGLVPHWSTPILAIAAAGYAVMLFVWSFVLMWGNLADLVTFWEETERPPAQ